MPRRNDTEQAWRRSAERAIGHTLDNLRGRSCEGLNLEPLYPCAKAAAPQPWRSNTAWSVAQRLDHPDAEAANRLVRLDIDGGADAVVLVGPASPWSRGFGQDFTARDLDFVFAEVEVEDLRFRLDAGPDTAEALAALAGLVEHRRLTSAALDVDIGYDPIGCGARLGRDLGDTTARILDGRAKAGLAGTVFVADSRPWHEAGAGEAQELAALLATTVAYLRRLETQGVSPEQGFRLVGALLAVDADIILGLAKVRALRRLWARIETACGLEAAPLRLHAETSWRMMTRIDPWTNVMRSTAATFAAGLGGADVITVMPFTLPFGLPDEAARRLARNTQRVLLDEAHLAHVVDPAAGSGAFETLTETLCHEAWRLFQEIEREGGIERALPGFKRTIAATAQARAEEIATLKRGIIGTSRFAAVEVPAPGVFETKPRAPLEPGPDALPSRRDAEPFEALRDRADQLAASGRRPQVFLATIGEPADFGPRAADAANFFAAAGIEALPAHGPRQSEALTEDFAASGTPIACLCGTNAAYRDAGPLVAALRARGATLVFMAGLPSQNDPSAPAIDAFIQDDCIRDDCDALGILDRALRALRTRLV